MNQGDTMASDVPGFEFQKEHDNTLDLRSAVMQAIGAASVCWTDTPRGIFESDRAAAIGDALLEFIGEGHIHGPLLGLATNRQLLGELSTRIEVDYFAGGMGLDYTSVDGRRPRPTQGAKCDD